MAAAAASSASGKAPETVHGGTIAPVAPVSIPHYHHVHGVHHLTHAASGGACCKPYAIEKLPEPVDVPYEHVVSDAELKKVISELRPTVNAILDACTKTSKPRAMQRLVELCDTFGHRLSGTETLERAILWAEAEMKKDGIENVRKERVAVPHWTRGTESCVLSVREPATTAAADAKSAPATATASAGDAKSANSVVYAMTAQTTAPKATAAAAPAAAAASASGSTGIRSHPFHILGVGNSVGTGGKVLSAPLLVVRDEADLNSKAKLAAGKIVLFNFPFTRYSEAVKYRAHGATFGARVGAVAVLIRSVTPVSLASPHTGVIKYADASVPKIPAACCTVEDAELAQRLHDAGKELTVALRMDATMHPEKAISHNLMGELVGRTAPEEIVCLGGHIDSWDVGQGAHDDAQGCIIGWESVRLLKELGITPRRTIRAVFWTNEENGARGGAEYFASRTEKEIDAHAAAIESDMGVSAAVGFGFYGTPEARSIVRRLMGELLAPINATRVDSEGPGVDIDVTVKAGGVPGFLLRQNDEWWFRTYFQIHHTEADTVDKINPIEYAQNLAAMTAWAYIMAELPFRLPRAPKIKGYEH